LKGKKKVDFDCHDLSNKRSGTYQAERIFDSLEKASKHKPDSEI
jgi:hypothetical protein